jgi:hypothetical protein
LDPDLEPEPDTDPLFRGKDQRIRNRIRTKMSRIPNTGKMAKTDRGKRTHKSSKSGSAYVYMMDAVEKEPGSYVCRDTSVPDP